MDLRQQRRHVQALQSARLNRLKNQPNKDNILEAMTHFATFLQTTNVRKSADFLRVLWECVAKESVSELKLKSPSISYPARENPFGNTQQLEECEDLMRLLARGGWRVL